MEQEQAAPMAGPDDDLEAEITIGYHTLRRLLPEIPEDKWLELKDAALDSSMRKFKTFMEQLRRQQQLDPDFVIKIGAVITILEYINDIFKIQRAIIEELKEAVSDGESATVATGNATAASSPTLSEQTEPAA